MPRILRIDGQAAVVAEIRRRSPRRGELKRLAAELDADPHNLSRYACGRRPVPPRIAEQLGFRIAYVPIRESEEGSS